MPVSKKLRHEKSRVSKAASASPASPDLIEGVLQRIMLLLDPPPGPEISAKELGFHTTLSKSSKR